METIVILEFGQKLELKPQLPVLLAQHKFVETFLWSKQKKQVDTIFFCVDTNFRVVSILEVLHLRVKFILIIDFDYSRYRL